MSLNSAFEIDSTPRLLRTATPCCHCAHLYQANHCNVGLARGFLENKVYIAQGSLLPLPRSKHAGSKQTPLPYRSFFPLQNYTYRRACRNLASRIHIALMRFSRSSRTTLKRESLASSGSTARMDPTISSAIAPPEARLWLKSLWVAVAHWMLPQSLHSWFYGILWCSLVRTVSIRLFLCFVPTEFGSLCPCRLPLTPFAPSLSSPPHSLSFSLPASSRREWPFDSIRH